MKTQQHNLNHAERTLCASELFGRPGQGYRTDRVSLDTGLVPAWEPAAMLGLAGLSAAILSFGLITRLIA